MYGKYLRRLQNARQLLKKQKQQLLDLELSGFVAITVHGLERSITIAVEHEAGMQAADILREEIHERLKRFKNDAKQLRQIWHENESLNTQTAPTSPHK